MKFLLLEWTASRCLIFKNANVAVDFTFLFVAVVISAPSCRRFRAVSPVGIYPNRASVTLGVIGHSLGQGITYRNY